MIFTANLQISQFMNKRCRSEKKENRRRGGGRECTSRGEVPDPSLSISSKETKEKQVTSEVYVEPGKEQF